MAKTLLTRWSDGQIDMRLLVMIGFLVSTAFLRAEDLDSGSNDPLVLESRISDIYADWSVGPDLVDAILSSGVVYTVTITYHIQNISRTNITVGETSSFLLRDEWKLDYPSTTNQTIQGCTREQHHYWGHPPLACDACGRYTTLASGQSTNLGRLYFTSPLRATAAVYRASLQFLDDGHGCGKQAWTGTLHAASLRIQLTTNATQRAQSRKRQ